MYFALDSLYYISGLVLEWCDRVYMWFGGITNVYGVVGITNALFGLSPTSV